MMGLVLIGTEESKRTKYFREAARQYDVPVSVVEWEQLDKALESGSLEGAVVKIDPPSGSAISLSDMKAGLEEYQRNLQRLEQMKGTFYNSPKAIQDLLNKRSCKLRLQSCQVPVTPMLLNRVLNVEQLRQQMTEKRIFSVFLKPVCFSGAAGVVAFRIHPYSGRMTVYTSCCMAEGRLVNTKTLYRMEDEVEIRSLLDALLPLDVMAEQWYPKSAFRGKSYDLRVVYQFGHIGYIVVRQSDGPVTNLHLNNQAVEFEALGLGRDVLKEIEVVCAKAVNAFSGLSVAGIDILLEKNSGKPYVIEMNGQGDLIYQDIERNNRIYREQVLQFLHSDGRFY